MCKKKEWWHEGWSGFHMKVEVIKTVTIDYYGTEKMLIIFCVNWKKIPFNSTIKFMSTKTCLHWSNIYCNYLLVEITITKNLIKALHVKEILLKKSSFSFPFIRFRPAEYSQRGLVRLVFAHRLCVSRLCVCLCQHFFNSILLPPIFLRSF